MKDFFDQARLDLQLQVLRHNREHPYPDTCQFCHSTIQMKPPSDEDVTAREADFDRQTFDITIDGYSKAAEQGKGYCALLNTVLLLAFHDYLNRRSSHALQWLLIDTPLLGFDEGVHAISTSMRAGLFDALKEQAKDQQIIILENTDHIDELDFDSNVNLIRFTKNRHQGRYGYLNDVYDITETTPLR
ncbi:hypothetical protein JS530_06065 [Bifidobacterium sp. LC6]|uniref:Uncharacterized protein n=1 Tax=Bifidobacterium colobi TaxID=2809026 RepID=A0ABS5UW78_9BIFI|nr:hypothetical protein [Bifidobacterium colobi]MBT1175070.1 hypothetical protein [Bifidobacterium colobi]